MKNDLSEFTGLHDFKKHPVSDQIDELFKSVIKEEKKMQKKSDTDVAAVAEPGELSLGDIDELDIGLSEADELPPENTPADDGIDLTYNDEEELGLGEAEYAEEEAESDDQYGNLSLDGEEADELALSDEALEDEHNIENIGELEFPDLPSENAPENSSAEGNDLSLGGFNLNGEDGLDLGEEESLSSGGDEIPELGQSEELSLGDESSVPDELSLSDDDPPAEIAQEDEIPSEEGLSLNFDSDESSIDLSSNDGDLSDDAKKKLEEIDAIMDFDASQVQIASQMSSQDENLDEPLVSEDLDLGSLNFSSDEDEPEVAEVVPPPKEEKAKKKRKEVETLPQRETRDANIGQDLKEIAGAYSGEMERMQATISNLRSDREELLTKIQKFEDDKLLQSRQNLSIRAELDEKKIELTIIRKKLNEEINDLKDRLKLFDEKKLILEEKNRILLQELDKAAQKNKIDVKKVQMRERELEQKLELLKADAETQIRNRDLKILELKRKIDAMEFDMESISQQEKRSVESRYELEDKLEKAIKTLRSAITVLEDESDRSNALTALKKNIDM